MEEKTPIVVCAPLTPNEMQGIIKSGKYEIVNTHCVECGRPLIANAETIRLAKEETGGKREPIGICIPCTRTPFWQEQFRGAEINASRVKDRAKAAVLARLITGNENEN